MPKEYMLTIPNLQTEIISDNITKLWYYEALLNNWALRPMKMYILGWEVSINTIYTLDHPFP